MHANLLLFRRDCAGGTTAEGKGSGETRCIHWTFGPIVRTLALFNSDKTNGLHKSIRRTLVQVIWNRFPGISVQFARALSSAAGWKPMRGAYFNRVTVHTTFQFSLFDDDVITAAEAPPAEAVLLNTANFAGIKRFNRRPSSSLVGLFVF